MTRHSVSMRPIHLLLLLASFAMPIYPSSVPVARGDEGAGNPQSPAASYAGKFSNDKLTVELSQTDGGYVGTITKGDNKFPAKATLTAQSLAGTFSASDSDFPFTATLANDQMILIVGKTTYTLTRISANPRDAGVPPANMPEQAPPTAPQAPAGPALGGSGPTFGAFSVLGSTDKGKTLFLKLPGGQTIEAAITQTADELGKVLDGKPNVTGAFADSKGKTKGGATFTGTLKGQNVQGTILAGTGTDDGSANVIVALAGASNDDIKALMSFMPAPLKMTTTKFPDGSGSVDLPDGWTTNTQSASNGIFVIGPAGQLVSFCNIREIQDPNCMTVRMGRQTYQTAMATYQIRVQQYNESVARHQQFPGIPGPASPPVPPVPPAADPNMDAIKRKLPFIYCKYCDGPEEVLKVMYPLLEDLGKRNGLPYTSLDKIIMVVTHPADPAHPALKSGVAYIALTDHDGDKAAHFRALNQISTVNVVPGESWQLTMCVMRAPDETFDKDLPVMSAIMNSVNVNEQVVTGEINAAGAAVRKMGQDEFNTMEKNHAAWQDQQAQQFADHEQQIGAQEQARHDSSSDFIEYIKGTRDVYDNATGQMHQVDLFHSDAIVGAENALANDPNRFVQIPLRYER